MVWALARSPLLQREVPGLSGGLQAAVRERVEEFSGVELSAMARDFFGLRLANSRYEAQWMADCILRIPRNSESLVRSGAQCKRPMLHSSLERDSVDLN